MITRTLLAASICIALLAGDAPSWKAPKPFPGTVVGDILKFRVNGASGVVYDARRKALLVNGDWREVFVTGLDGRRIRRVRLPARYDLEGITLNPADGMVYLVTERTDSILELDPKTFAVRREFPIERTFKGKTVLDRSGDGLEGITFRPDARHPEGGTFFVCNQGSRPRPGDDAIVLEIEAPLKSGGAKGGRAKILRTFRPGPPDLAGLHYDAVRDRLYAVSGRTRLLIEMTTAGNLTAAYRLPRPVTTALEGITFDDASGVYVTLDGGGVIKFTWDRPMPTSRPTTRPAGESR